MIKLIKNELIKIFKKKSIYITLLVILAFVVLTNCIYKFFYNGIYSYEVYSDEYIQYIKEEISKLNKLLTSYKQIYDIVFKNAPFKKRTTKKIKKDTDKE